MSIWKFWFAKLNRIFANTMKNHTFWNMSNLSRKNVLVSLLLTNIDKIPKLKYHYIWVKKTEQIQQVVQVQLVSYKVHIRICLLSRSHLKLIQELFDIQKLTDHESYAKFWTLAGKNFQTTRATPPTTPKLLQTHKGFITWYMVWFEILEQDNASSNIFCSVRVFPWTPYTFLHF